MSLWVSVKMEPTAYKKKFDTPLIMSTFRISVKWTLRSIIALTLVCPGCAHYEADVPRMNVIPGKACGLQTEMRYLDVLGKYNLIQYF